MNKLSDVQCHIFPIDAPGVVSLCTVEDHAIGWKIVVWNGRWSRLKMVYQNGGATAQYSLEAYLSSIPNLAQMPASPCSVWTPRRLFPPPGTTSSCWHSQSLFHHISRQNSWLHLSQMTQEHLLLQTSGLPCSYQPPAVNKKWPFTCFQQVFYVSCFYPLLLNQLSDSNL